MESSNFEPPPDIPPAEPPVEPPVEQITPEQVNEGIGFFAWFKNFIIILFLLAIVVSCAWIVFNLGKSIVMPANRPQPERIQAAIPETPPSIKALQKALSAETRSGKKAKLNLEMPKLTIKPKPVIKEEKVAPLSEAVVKAEPVTRAVKPVRETAVGNHYFKVQAGFYRHKGSAAAYADKIKSAGFDIYVKRLSAGWRVQVGAFKTRAEAEKLRSSLGEKGFKSVVIYE